MAEFLVAFVVFYLYHGLGITVGYHRLLAHRSLKVPRWLEYLLVSGGYLCLEGSPISWVTNHRLHHKHTDRESDPHSPQNGFWHSFAGWLYRPQVAVSRTQSLETSPDLYRVRLYRFLNLGFSSWRGPLCLCCCLIFRGLILAALGSAVLAANLAASTIVFVSPLLVNSVCHLKRFGYRSFSTSDESRNVWWIALISLGEGWHNNHHAVPQSARHGLKLWELDPSWWAIWLMRRIGLAANVRLPQPDR